MVISFGWSVKLVGDREFTNSLGIEQDILFCYSYLSGFASPHPIAVKYWCNKELKPAFSNSEKI